MSLKNFFDFNLQALKQFLTANLNIEEKKTSMRAKQLWQAIYKKGLIEFNHLTNLPTELRGELSSNISLEKPKIVNTQKSSDGTIKWLIQLLDGNKVECVFIPEKTRGTLCISSQVGCTLNCRFCHTGTQRLVKNLNFSEIVNQVMALMAGFCPAARARNFTLSCWRCWVMRAVMCSWSGTRTLARDAHLQFFSRKNDTILHRHVSEAQLQS